MMLMKAPGGGGGGGGGTGRDVIFRLTVEPDKGAVAKLRTWGDDMRREQAVFDTASKRTAKEIGDAYAKTFSESVKHAKDFQTSATRSFNQLAETSHLRARDFTRDWKQAADQVQARLNRVKAPGIAGGGWADTVYYGGGAGGGGRAGGGGVRGGGFNVTRTGEGINNLVNGGVNLARGIAYSGLVGEEDSQKILDSLLRIEGYAAGIHGVVALAKGASALGLFGGGAAAGGAGAGGGGGALAIGGTPALAGIAALIGTALAGNGIYEQATGKANNPGSQSYAIAPYWARLAEWDYRTGRSMFGEDYSGGGRGQYGRHLAESEDRVASQNKAMTRDQQMRAANLRNLNFKFDDMEDPVAERITRNERRVATGIARNPGQALDLNTDSLSAAYGHLTQVATLHKQIASDQSRSDAERKLAADREMKALQVVNDLTQKQIALRREEQITAKGTYDIAKKEFDLKNGRYMSQMERFGEMAESDPEAFRQLRVAGYKARAGQRLSPEEAQALSSFEDYAPIVSRQRQQTAMAYGGDFFFNKSRQEAQAAADVANAAGVAGQKVGLQMNSKLELVITDDSKSLIGQLEAFGDQIVEKLLQHEERKRAELKDQIMQEIAKGQNARQIMAKR